MALSVLPLATGIAVATAAVGLLFGFVHGITLAFGVAQIFCKTVSAGDSRPKWLNM